MATTPLPPRETRALTNPAARFGEIGLVNFEADKFFNTAALRGNGRISDPKKWIEHRLHAGQAVQLDAPFH